MSNKVYQGEFFEQFGGLNDPRQEGKVWHSLTDILFIVSSGILCGYDEWEMIHEWASAPATQAWLRTHIALKNGMPSVSTIKRGFGFLNPDEFSAAFIAWMQKILGLPEKDVIAVDGKTSKGSKGKNKALHLVSAWCQSHGLVIGQTKTDEKSNEITAIPTLLEQLFIEGCIVTIDAMGLQKKIVQQIVNEKKADYVIALKGNQGTLQEEVKRYFEGLEPTGKGAELPFRVEEQSESGAGLAVHRTLEKGHGRIEKRTYVYETNLAWMVEAKRDWEKLTGIGMVIREVTEVAEPSRTTKEIAYYVGSVGQVTDFARAVRAHWGVESMHWSLDVVFGDDRNRTQESAAAQNLAMVKRMVFNALQMETTVYPKKSKTKKRIAAATDSVYRDRLMKLAFSGC